ncbi:hypothetical protein [Leucobacter iarius]|uniref:Uncharacterized protein n=1 Tax=Leucobacter iarius TaxID=333963 RepID=A0ABN2L6F2_9MICO
MGAKRISLSDGFEDLLGTLRGATGDYPSETEMSVVSGEGAGVADLYKKALRTSGGEIFKQIKLLDERLQEAEQKMRQSIAEQKNTESQAADTLRRLLADLEGVRGDVVGEAPVPAKSANKSPAPKNTDFGKPGSA